MADNLIEICNKYIEKGKIDKFYDYIKTNDLTHEFVRQAFQETYNRGFQCEELEKIENVTNFALKISMSDMKAKYGEKLTDKFAEIIYNTPQPSKKMFNLFSLMKNGKQIVKENEIDNIEKILELSSNKDNVIGTHIIGADIR